MRARVIPTCLWWDFCRFLSGGCWLYWVSFAKHLVRGICSDVSRMSVPIPVRRQKKMLHLQAQVGHVSVPFWHAPGGCRLFLKRVWLHARLRKSRKSGGI